MKPIVTINVLTPDGWVESSPPALAEALIKQTHEGWHISTAAGSMRCRSRQEAMTRLTAWMRRADTKVRKVRASLKKVVAKRGRRKPK